jgi:CheY-like chemotaxis protein
MLDDVRKLILIADDYDDAAALLADFVQVATGYETIWASDGQQALELIDGRAPDACVLDIDMPHIGGEQAAREIRARFGEQRPLLIALSGRAAGDELDWRDLFDHVLKKPVDTDRLLRVLAGA